VATNPYISQKVRSEQNLYEDLVIESLQFYGQDVYYLPREIINKDRIFVDDIPSRFTDAYKIEMYIENIEGFDGEGDLFTKFGVELRDQASFVVARRRWKQLIGARLEEADFRPREGDLIYLPLSNSIFEIRKVETETPFYQLSQLPTFRMQCELFEYSDEDFDTDIEEIDAIEFEGAYQYALTLPSAESSRAEITLEIDQQGSVQASSINNSGFGYSAPPTITISDPDSGFSKFGNSSLNVNLLRGKENSYKQLSNNGIIEMFVYLDQLPSANQKAGILITGGSNEDSGEQLRFVYGVNENGKLISTRFNNLNQEPKIYSDVDLTVNNWHHLLIGADSTNHYVYLDGDKVFDSTHPEDLDLFTGEGYAIGFSAIGTYDSEQWVVMNGYIDEFRASVGTKSSLLSSRFTGSFDSSIDVPEAEFDSDSDTAALLHLNGRPVSLSISIDSDDGSVSSVSILDSGEFYLTTPTVTLSLPYQDSDFVIGETVTQVNSSYTIKGEVTDWSDSDRILQLAHVGSTDGNYHTFTTGKRIVGSESGAVSAVSLVQELQEIQKESQNTVFDDFESDFLDFTESNPFGDMQ